MNEVKITKQKVDHYLNAIKMSILRGTSKTSIDMSIKDEITLGRLGNDIVPVSTLNKLGKVQFAEANEKYLLLKQWVEETQDAITSVDGLGDEDKYSLISELKEVLDEIVTGSITMLPHAVLMSYLKDGYTFDGSLTSDAGREFIETQGGFDTELLRESCTPGPAFIKTLAGLGQEANERAEGLKIPFPVNYLIYAEMTEIDLIANTDKAPATANSLRVKLAKNFQAKLDKGLLSSREEMSLYRILGPERIQPKAAVEVNNNNVTQNNQQVVVIKNSEKLRPKNLIVGENSELLGVGKSYGNIDKSQLLRLAAGELASSEESEGSLVEARLN